MANYASAVIDIALGEVGYLEKKSNKSLDSKTANAGSANYTKYGRDMHELYPSVMDFPAAWCDAFVDWCFQKAYGISNAKGLLGGNFNDYTPSSAQLYKNKNAWGNTPKIGAQIFFKNSTRICHTGLVYDYDDRYVYTVEGNTSGASGVVANGGGVCKKKYLRTNSKIAGYGYPKYDGETVKKTTDKTVNKASSTKDVKATGTADKFDEKLAGTYTTTANLNLRNDAGTGNKSLCIVPKGTKVKCYGYYSLSKGVNWLYVETTVNGTDYTGFCSKSYLKK
jgi:hypothetical protein